MAYLDPSGKGFLTYKDFLDGLVVLDPEVFAKEQPDYILGGRDGLLKVEDERPSTPELRAEVSSMPLLLAAGCWLLCTVVSTASQAICG